MNRKGKRTRRLYLLVYGAVYIALCGGAVAAILAAWPKTPDRSGTGWTQFAFMGAHFLAILWGRRVACAACRARGLDRGGLTERVLEPIAPDLEVPAPRPLRHSTLSVRQRRAASWLFLPIVALFATVSVSSWKGGDWLMAIVGTLGTPFWIWMGRAAWAGRAHDDLEVDGRGLWDNWKARVVPWKRVRRGRVREEWDIGGDLIGQQLRLEDESGRCVWSADVKSLPPDVRENLFAWVRSHVGIS